MGKAQNSKQRDKVGIDTVQGSPVDRPFEVGDKAVWKEHGEDVMVGEVLVMVTKKIARVRRDDFNDTVCISIAEDAKDTWNYGKYKTN